MESLITRGRCTQTLLKLGKAFGVYVKLQIELFAQCAKLVGTKGFLTGFSKCLL